MGEVSKLLGQDRVIELGKADVTRIRERTRRRRLAIVFALIFIPELYLWARYADGRPFNPFILPDLGPDFIRYLPLLLLIPLILVMMLPYLGGGRSPHVTWRPEQIDVTFDDVKGLDAIKEEVVRTLNVFLGYATFRRELGGTPRRGLLFEGPPGTGKTHMAKAMARHAGVPFLFVAAPAFQSMWYGMTARKIRRYFTALKKTARNEGGAIGFIEEIDAIGGRRGGMESAIGVEQQAAPAGRAVERAASSGTGGTVNELLIQMQSFDDPPFGVKVANKLRDMANLVLPASLSLRKRGADYSNILVIAATNRGDMLDPALLRPGRFDRRLYFDLPSRKGRRELIDYFLAKKRHAPELDAEDVRDRLAGVTFGYTPVMIEHMLDEALIWALREDRDGMTWEDITRAKLTAEIGLPHHVTYTTDERRTIATHEAGHATAAYFVGKTRKLEVLSIVKRKGALGLLFHSDVDERYTRTHGEMSALIKIALAGMAAEEIFEGQSSTSPAADLTAATQMAAEMIGGLGLGKSLISYHAAEEGMFSQGLVARVLGNSDAKRAVDDLLHASKREIKGVLERNREVVIALRDALLEREELIGDEIVDVIEQSLKRRRKRPRPQQPTSVGARVVPPPSRRTRAPRAAAEQPLAEPQVSAAQERRPKPSR